MQLSHLSCTYLDALSMPWPEWDVELPKGQILERICHHLPRHRFLPLNNKRISRSKKKRIWVLRMMMSRDLRHRHLRHSLLRLVIRMKCNLCRCVDFSGGKEERVYICQRCKSVWVHVLGGSNSRVLVIEQYICGVKRIGRLW